jgi:hypothetical protein
MSFFLRISEKIYNILKIHGPILLILIFFILISNLFSAITYIFLTQQILEFNKNLTNFHIITFLTLSLINISSMIGLLYLKKIALYVFFCSAIISLIINLTLNLNLLASIQTLIAPAILLLFIYPKWKSFD